MTGLDATRVVTPQGVVGPARVEIARGRIVAVRPVSGDVADRVLTPGFIDLQVNGHDDVDIALAGPSEWDRLDDLLVAQGVTTWCPTLTSRELDEYGTLLAEIADIARTRRHSGPDVAGVHLEGPFLSPDHAGAHRHVHPGPVDLVWLARLPQDVRLVTIAPELPGAIEAISDLAARGVVVALGHSGANTETARAAVDAGARLVTHVFNAMAPLHHRRPGVAGTALTDDRLVVSVIADLVHVHPDVVSLVFRSKGTGGVALTTDATAWRSPALAGQVELDGGAVRLPDGTLAGSCLTMDRAVSNVVDRCGVTLEAALAAASAAPAAALGLTDRGRIEPGARADLVSLGPDRSVDTVWIAGEEVYRRN